MKNYIYLNILAIIRSIENGEPPIHLRGDIHICTFIQQSMHIHVLFIVLCHIQDFFNTIRCSAGIDKQPLCI